MQRKLFGPISWNRRDTNSNVANRVYKYTRQSTTHNIFYAMRNKNCNHSILVIKAKQPQPSSQLYLQNYEKAKKKCDRNPSWCQKNAKFVFCSIVSQNPNGWSACGGKSVFETYENQFIQNSCSHKANIKRNIQANQEYIDFFRPIRRDKVKFNWKRKINYMEQRTLITLQTYKYTSEIYINYMNNVFKSKQNLLESF